MKIAIIIPVFNEAETIGRLLTYLIHEVNNKNNIQEIIVVDGGSTDNSAHIVNELATKYEITIRVVVSEKGRAKQLNHGASVTQAEILYFLHADSFPPNTYDKEIIEQVMLGNEAGCFRMKFDYNHWWLRFLSWLTRFRSKRCRGGDQSQFITKTLFEQIGGYNESYIVYEDNDLVARLFAINQFTIIPKNIITSARKYREIGVWKLQYYFLNIHLRKWMGSSPEDLYAYYKKKVKC